MNNSFNTTGNKGFLSYKAIVETGLLKRILITIALLGLYRLGVQIPLPSVNHELFQQSSDLLSSGVLGMVDMFAGGALSALSILALGIGPFITASIMMQLLAEIFPYLKELQREHGEDGRRQYQQWVRRLSVLLAIFQAFALAKFIQYQHLQVYQSSLEQTGIAQSIITSSLPMWLFFAKIVILMAAGSLLVMWLGELISVHGIGNGGSLLIFAGIGARLPQLISQTYSAYQTGSIPTWGLITFLVVVALVICAIICLQEGVRKLLMIGARHNYGREVSTAVNQAHYLPLRVNPAGVLPIIFASMMMFVPFQILNFIDKGKQANLSVRIHDLLADNGLTASIVTKVESIPFLNKAFAVSGTVFDNLFSYYTWEHSLLYFVLILVFAYFWASIYISPRDIAENLQKGGTAISGIKPGKPTGDYLEYLVTRLVFIGGTAIALITVLPIHAEKLTQVTTLGGLGSTSLIIMVGVAIDMYNQMNSHMQSHQYKVKSLIN